MRAAPIAVLLLLLLLPGGRLDAETIVFLGDSLTAGLGVEPGEAYPAVLEARWRADGLDWRAINAGVSGDTSKGGLERLDWLLRGDPDVVVVALGANDGLRGLPVAGIRANLAAILERLQGAGVRVVLCGMRLPTNYGDDYAERFHALYHELAERYDVAFDPFLLEGVAMDPALNQADRAHPNAAGHVALAERLDPLLRAVVAGDDPATAAAAAEEDADARP